MTWLLRYDKRIIQRKLHIASFLKLFVFAQLNETESFRAVSETLFSDDLQKATDLKSISFSQLGRRLNQVPAEVFRHVFWYSLVHLKIVLRTISV